MDRHHVSTQDVTTDHQASASESGGSEASASRTGLFPDIKHERFQIGAKLGQGGMGVVYRARNGRDGREVALKLMKGSLAGTAQREQAPAVSRNNMRRCRRNRAFQNSVVVRISGIGCERTGDRDQVQKCEQIADSFDDLLGGK